MELNDILKRHQGSLKKNGSYISLTTANSSAVWPMIEKMSLRELQLIRSLHLELTLENISADSVQQFLLDHIDQNIAQLLDYSSNQLRYDRNTEIGFDSRSKMKSLFEILKQRAYQCISSEGFYDLYTSWLEAYGIADLTISQSSKEINEVFTFYLIQEEDEDFTQNLTLAIENMLDELYSDYAKRLKSIAKVTDEWNSEAEKIFGLLDEDRKGHIETEALQFWVLSVLLTKVGSLEPILLRKQTSNFLQEMRATNGLVTLRCWKNYLLKNNWKRASDLQILYEQFVKVIETWKSIRKTIFTNESLINYSFLSLPTEELPSIWDSCIQNSIKEVLINKSESEKLHKFLRFVGFLLGSTPNLSTKGVIYLQGTYIRELGEFSVYLMSNYLQLSGQYHTSSSIVSMTQQEVDTLSSDLRFKAIRKSLQTYDSLLNIVFYEIVATCPKPIKQALDPVQVVKRLQYSSTTNALSGKIRNITPNSSFVSANKTIKRENTTPIKKQIIKKTQTPTRSTNTTPQKTRTLDMLENTLKSDMKRTLPKPQISPQPVMGRNVEVKKVTTRNGVSPIQRAKTPTKSPMRSGNKETYEQVMKRLSNK